MRLRLAKHPLDYLVTRDKDSLEYPDNSELASRRKEKKISPKAPGNQNVETGREMLQV